MSARRILTLFVHLTLAFTLCSAQTDTPLGIRPVCPDSVYIESFFWNNAYLEAIKTSDSLIAYPPYQEITSAKALKKARKQWEKRLEQLNPVGGLGALDAGAGPQGAEALRTASLSWSLFTATGEAKYVDVFERALFNGVYSALGGHEKAEVRQEAAAWVKAAPLFACAASDSCIYVNLYSRGGTSIRTATAWATVEQLTSYPWAASVNFWVHCHQPGQRFTLRIRIPGWARGELVPGGRFACSQRPKTPDVTVANERYDADFDDGWLVIDREWGATDRVVIHINEPILRIHAAENGRVTDRSRFAYQRGPLVYAAPGGMEGYGIREKETVGNNFDNKVRNVYVFSTRRKPLAAPQSEGEAVELTPYYKSMFENPDATTVWHTSLPDK